MARSDHWRCVSMRHQGAPFLKGHFQTPALYESADDLFYRLGGIRGKNGGWRGRLPDGSRVRTQRMGKGSYPERYHSAVPVHISSVRSP